jgi:hypothetical protein
MKNNSKVAIVVPAHYKPKFTADELISLKHLKKYLYAYDKYFIVPDNTNFHNYREKGFRYIKFPKKYFSSAKTYNKLLLKETFYKKFAKYEYILIHQLDALVFSDRLLKWCNSDYDYIAAPWFGSKIGLLSHKQGLPANGGNGGFSLRKVESFLKVLQIVKKQIRRSSDNPLIQKIWFIMAILTGESHKTWLHAPADNYPFNEDGFWSLEAPKYLNSYKVAPFKEALKFSFERFPRRCLKLNNNTLPFGCHAWAKYDRRFWLPYILKH